MQGTGDALRVGFQLAIDVVVAGGFGGREGGWVGGRTCGYGKGEQQGDRGHPGLQR